jgi:hypothetical protein
MDSVELRTVEYGVSDETTRIYCLVVTNSQRLTIPLVQITGANTLSFQLIRVQTLHISSMVLKEVGKLIVHEYWLIHIRWYVKLDDALLALTDVWK